MKRKNAWLLSGWFVFPLLTVNAIASDSDINITGQVVAAPCTVRNNSLDVDLGKVEASTLSAAGSFSDAVPFSLVLVDCPASTSQVGAKFDGQSPQDDASLYLNTGTANNADVEIRGAYSGIVLGPGSAANAVSVDADRQATFNFTARIKSVKGEASVGSVAATALVTFTYQ